jgi:hypothetical protein
MDINLFAGISFGDICIGRAFGTGFFPVAIITAVIRNQHLAFVQDFLGHRLVSSGDGADIILFRVISRFSFLLGAFPCDETNQQKEKRFPTHYLSIIDFIGQDLPLHWDGIKDDFILPLRKLAVIFGSNKRILYPILGKLMENSMPKLMKGRTDQSAATDPEKTLQDRENLEGYRAQCPYLLKNSFS